MYIHTSISHITFHRKVILFIKVAQCEIGSVLRIYLFSFASVFSNNEGASSECGHQNQNAYIRYVKRPLICAVQYFLFCRIYSPSR